MKKLVFAFVLIMLFTSCSKNILSAKEVSAAAERSFSSAANILAGGYNYGVNITKNGAAITFSVTDPAELSGLELCCDGEKLRVGYKGAAEEFTEGFLPESAPISLFCEMLSTLLLTEDFSLSTEGELTKAEGKNFILKLRTENAEFVSAHFPEYETEISFSEFVFSAEN